MESVGANTGDQIPLGAEGERGRDRDRWLGMLGADPILLGGGNTGRSVSSGPESAALEHNGALSHCRER